MDDRLLTAAEVADLLAVPESWVPEHTRRGNLPHLQLGRYVRYRRTAVVAWVANQETPRNNSRAIAGTPSS